ncbi:glycosyl hydrolase family 28-related protein [Echinimonas agarilytica]|uniref:Rhamnogalacturonase A/B/Epimerase-like pectate lyase domain-containing protein n=1 Tax=Echinimonas agarilytica TaxID=1215918 RepID=A0AA41WBN0_9GAMM|nr:glycosyl hydrolase family 28-related protein [Echinimonas agarilytica]MCM2681497.1 hypothetical protein [Echinimonas agarilytica]
MRSINHLVWLSLLLASCTSTAPPAPAESSVSNPTIAAPTQPVEAPAEPFPAPVDIMPGATAAQLRTQIEAQQIELDILLVDYTEHHPSARIVAKRLAALKAQLSRMSPEQVADAAGWVPKILQQHEVYLPDFSFAGYQWGEITPKTNATQIIDVTDFGAIANDRQDDSDAIIAALDYADTVPGAVIVSFPSGLFTVNRIIAIERSHIVLRGQGSSGQSATTLYMPQALRDLAQSEQEQHNVPNLISNNLRATDNNTSPVSWKGGFIWTRTDTLAHHSPLQGQAIKGEQGGHSLHIEGAAGFSIGQTIMLNWCDTGCERASFTHHLMGNTNTPLGTAFANHHGLVKQYLTITQVNGTSIQVKEPLLHDVKPQWKVSFSQPQFLTEVGFEDFRVEFPTLPYAGHHKERGYNGLFLTELKHSWVKNVTVVNADSAFLVDKSANVTLDEIRASGRQGHYSMTITNSNYVLAQRFSFTAPSLHTPAVGWNAELNVYSGGTVRSAKFNLHRGLNQQNLFDNIAVQLSGINDLFTGAGNPASGPLAAAYTTYWNIRTQGNPRGMIDVESPEMRLVGLTNSAPIGLAFNFKAYVEGLNQEGVEPSSLYRYQLAQRKH